VVQRVARVLGLLVRGQQVPLVRALQRAQQPSVAWEPLRQVLQP
jgi:hypothetical protein